MIDGHISFYSAMVSDVKLKKLSIAEHTINATKIFFGENWFTEKLPKFKSFPLT